MKILGALALAICQFSSIAMAGSNCPAGLEEQTDTLASWKSIHAFVSQYRSCIDGGVAEGVDDAIHKLWADHWDTVPAMLSITKKDKAFEAFVLKSICAETFEMKAYARFRKHAETECPSGGTVFCEAALKTCPSA